MRFLPAKFFSLLPSYTRFAAAPPAYFADRWGLPIEPPYGHRFPGNVNRD
jgi:hypothetical protein